MQPMVMPVGLCVNDGIQLYVRQPRICEGILQPLRLRPSDSKDKEPVAAMRLETCHHIDNVGLRKRSDGTAADWKPAAVARSPSHTRALQACRNTCN